MSRRFIDVLLARADEHDIGITFIESEGESHLPYADLAAAAPNWAAALAEAGVRPGDTVVLQIGGNRDLVHCFWGAVHLGAVPAPMPPAQSPADAARVARAHALLGRPKVLSDGRARVDDALADSIIDTAELRRLAARGDARPEPAEVPADAPRLIQFSSGSTGTPKGIVVTEANLVAGLEACVPQRKARVRNSMLTWLPLTHNLSLIGFHVYAILQDYGQVLMPTSAFVMDPISWLQAITRHRPTVSACPNFAFRHLLRALAAAPDRARGVDLSSIHKIMCGSEPVDPELAARFQRELAPLGLRANAVNAGYGLSEACLMVSVTEIYEPLHTLRLDRSRLSPGATLEDALAAPGGGADFVSVGRAVPGLEVSIRDEAGADAGEGVVGEIHVAGAPVTAAVLTAEGIRSQELAPDGALPTGDIGILVDGELYVVGRKKDIIFVGGKNFYSNDLERVIEEGLGIDCAIIGRTSPERGGEEIVVFPRRRADLDEESAAREIRSRLMRETGVPVDRLLWVDRIPTTANGKKARHALEGML